MPVPVPNQERAPLLRVFAGLAEQVALLVRIRPSLAQRLIFAPPQAVHSVAMYLCHGVPADLTEAEIAEVIEQNHPRDLLLRTFPSVPRALYSSLGRSGDRACEPQVYKRVAALAAGEFSEPYLNGDPLAMTRLAYYEALTRSDPIVRQVFRALPEDLRLVEAVNGIIAVLRAHEAVNGIDIHLPQSAGKAAVLRRLMGMMDAVSTPPLPFPVPAPYRVIEDIGALRRVGLAYKNCIRDSWSGPRYWLGAARGEDVFLTCDEPRFVAHFFRVAPGLYVLTEIAGQANKAVADDDRTTLVEALRAVGAKIIDDDPIYMLTRLMDRLGGERRNEGGDDADDGAMEDGLDGLAA